jgi:Kdo2-lipid IVA lauroyltransferase/acyltransferase
MKTARLLPRSFWIQGGRLMGTVFFFLSARHRHQALCNLKTAFIGRFSAKQRRKIARQSFAHFGGVLGDFIYIDSLPAEKMGTLIRLEGAQHLAAALRKKKGVLVFTAHFGFWEIASFPVSRFAPLWVIARPMDNSGLERLVSRVRGKLGARVIPKFQAGRKVLRILRNQNIAAILIDQNVLREESVFVDFFGKNASTTPALAAFHLRTRAPVVPVFCCLTEQNIYQVDIQPAVDFSYTGDYRRDVKNITQICTKIIEAQIRRHPGQWLWFHDRWRSRPEPPCV